MTGRDKQDLYDAVKTAVHEAFDERVDQAVEDRMPVKLGELLGPEIHHAISARTRRWRLLASVGYLALFLGLGYAVHDNRQRSTAARGVVCQIIVGGDQSLYTYLQEGSITRRQLRRALMQSAEYRRLLGPAPHCTPTLTPEPKRLPPAPHR